MPLAFGVLLMNNNTPIAKGILTGKLFEYLSSGRPILCIGPEDGDAAHLISEAKAGVTVGFDDKEMMKTAIMQLYEAYKKGITHQTDMKLIGFYSRKENAAAFTQLLNGLTNK